MGDQGLVKHDASDCTTDNGDHPTSAADRPYKLLSLVLVTRIMACAILSSLLHFTSRSASPLNKWIEFAVGEIWVELQVENWSFEYTNLFNIPSLSWCE